jgi:hypothetical protein
MSHTRRQFIAGSVAVGASALLPAALSTPISDPVTFIGMDFGSGDYSAAWKYWWDAEQEIFRITAIPMSELYKVD